jgi:hypothetical protein
MEILEKQIVKNVKGLGMSQTGLTRNANKGRIHYIYDLNIYQLEQEQDDGSFDYSGPWYIHVYEYENSNIEEVLDPIELTPDEYNNLIANDPYFEESDVWYGLQGFMLEKWGELSDRLKAVFESLPKYKHENLFR